MPRTIWLAIGWSALVLAVVGTLLPIVPTVPFLLVAGWAFSRSSPKLRERIRQDPRYGAAVRAWQDHGAVSGTAKIWAVTAMSAGVGLSLWMGIDARIVAAQATICLLVSIYVLSRPRH